MNADQATAADAGSWPTYKRLLGYTRGYWAIGLVAFVGMLADGGGLALFILSRSSSTFSASISTQTPPASSALCNFTISEWIAIFAIRMRRGRSS